MRECVLLLHNIRSVHNVGSIFRTADAAGASRVILSGYTPTPLDRFKRERADFSKVSLGAENTVPWEQVKNPAAAIQKLKRGGFTVAAVEQSEDSTPLFNYSAPEKIALILGNEVRGLSKALLNKADVVLEIPMRGKKESLNVSVTAGIAMYQVSKPFFTTK